jgi:hypothetical protein
VPAGGTANQVLAKIDATNYNTQWVTPATGLTLPLGQNLTFAPDATYDVGVSTGVNRPRDIYAANTVQAVNAVFTPIVGTQANLDFSLRSNGTDRFVIQNNGHLRPVVDGSYDIGNATHQIGNLYASANIHLGQVLFYRTNPTTDQAYVNFGANGSLAFAQGSSLIWRRNYDNVTELTLDGSGNLTATGNVIAATVKAGGVTLMGTWGNGNGAVATNPAAKGTGSGGPVDPGGDGWLILDVTGTPVYVPYWT